ncbi:MAG: glycosyltransferase family 9 protein [Candidatus Omnitrophota bacterium]|nr:glycosyltransferase family 9 protein [Candidatus Omnitrophota bacterium]
MLNKVYFKNILVIRNDRFGEFLLNIPALRALKETYPDSRLTLAVDPSVKDLAECVECCDEVVLWDKQFKKTLRKRRFDACLVLNPAKEAHWAAFFAGIPVRVGYDRKWGILLTHKMQDNKYLGLRHEVEYNLELVGLIGAETSDRSISLAKLPAGVNLEYAGAVAIHPYTSDLVKQWPVEKFQVLAKRLAEESGVKVLIVGKDKERAGEFDDLGNGIINLINTTTLVELAQILKQSQLLISCDSGPMHLSAVVGTPVVALFRNDLPGKTARRWGPWGDGHMVIEKNSLLDITVNEILNKIKGILK